MKKHMILVILLAMTIALAACNKEPEILCGNCAAAVPGDSFFCPNCGTEFFQKESNTAATTETTMATTETTAATTTTTENTAAQPENNPVTQTPAVSTHTHSFSAATCLQPQTCACGATSGDLGDHQYLDYACFYCGAVDLNHAYEYLCTMIATYGHRNDGLYRIDVSGDYADMYSLVYDPYRDYAYATYSFDVNGEFFLTCIWLDTFQYSTGGYDCTLEGVLDPAYFTAISPLPVSSFSGDASLQEAFVSIAQDSVCEILDWLDDYLYYNNAGILIADLGFTAY